MPDQSILLFGGTFDPIHNGHLIISRAAAELLEVDRLILIPAAQPPHKTGAIVASAPDRLRMAELATADDPLFHVCDCELNRPGPSFTLDTINHLRSVFGPAARLYWLIGADTIKELPTWYKVKQLAAACTIVTAARPGYASEDFTPLQSTFDPDQIADMRAHLLATPTIDISATNIRHRIKHGQPVDHLIPRPVHDYITAKDLYQENES